MKKLSISLLATILLACSGLAFAEEGKIAVFNLQTAILSTDDAQKQIKAFESSNTYTDLRANIEQMRADLQKLDDDLTKNNATWADDRKMEQRRKMEFTGALLELYGQKLQSENQTLIQQVLQAHSNRARTALQEIIQAENIGLALDREVVAYANSSYDITAKITDRLNKAN